MKMRKLLAGGVAASVAVSSLATFASAETKSFNMGIPAAIDSAKRTVSYGSVIGETIGSSATQTNMQIVEFNFDTWMDAEEIWMGLGSKMNLNVKGYKLTEIAGESQVSAVNRDYTIIFGDDAAVAEYGSYVKDKWFIVVLPDSEYSYKDGEFAPSYFTTIEEMSVTIEAEWACGTSNKNTYVNMKGKDLILGVGNVTVSDWKAVKGAGVASNPVSYIDVAATNATNVATALKADNGAAALIGYALTNGGYKPSSDSFGKNLKYGTINWAVQYSYPALVKTDANDDNILKRQEILKLSISDEHDAQGATGDDHDQSHDSEHEGDTPYQFAGLATQVAEFFNKQTNGTITFKFTAPAAAGTTTNDWITGGVPSTQVGLRNDFASSWTDSDFALYVNYEQTGSLEALASVDAASGSVTFDISEILDTLGGQTLGVVDNLYYGLTANAVKALPDNKLYVQEIILEYAEDAAEDIVDEDDDVADDDADEDDDVVEDDADEDDADADIDEDDADEDDDADADVDEDEDDADEDDANVAGDTVVAPSEDDDANPNTGVALAVVPALVAAAAAVVSKKRK